METGTSICILGRDRPETLRETVDAILRFATQPYEVVIVDNASTDSGTKQLLDNFERRGWTIIRNDQNLGLSRGVNQGLWATKYDVLIHLDDDALVRHAGWNQLMADYVRRPEIGIAMPFWPGSEYIDCGDYRAVRWGLGFIWAIKKTLFDDIGGYDEQLVHQNECDLGIRVRMAGFRAAAIPGFAAKHNDPGGHRSAISVAREHFGTVQFRDKWSSYFRGRNYHYGSAPLYLMEQWPPDQLFFDEMAKQCGVDQQINPHLDGADEQPWQKMVVRGREYLVFRELRNRYTFWIAAEAFTQDRALAAARWLELTGESYSGYKWPNNLLRV